VNQSPATAGQPYLDPTLTLALAVASKAAYDYYSGAPITPPPGYVQVDAWTGWDSFLLGGSEEKYGLAFQSSTQPGTLIFAFRGTDSDLDAWEDAHFLTTTFAPAKGAVSGEPRVSTGFYGIYNDTGGGMTASMRQQLFVLLAKYQPTQVYVTGHSLGAALCQLFTLDLAISQPTPQLNINFASPMVGTDSWQAVYDATIPAANSVRVYNYWDYVPSLPPSEFGYRTVGCGFSTAFHVQGEWFPHELSRHSIVNLTTVLTHALPVDPQQWAGTFPDYVDPAWTMESTVPPASSDVRWVEKLREHMEYERSLRTAHVTAQA
jgi:triacylglycerol lipase